MTCQAGKYIKYMVSFISLSRQLGRFIRVDRNSYEFLMLPLQSDACIKTRTSLKNSYEYFLTCTSTVFHFPFLPLTHTSKKILVSPPICTPFSSEEGEKERVFRVTPTHQQLLHVISSTLTICVG
jgi:hypothetical protein